MNNPQTILATLDSFLKAETRLVLYGRAALQSQVLEMAEAVMRKRAE